MKKSLIAALALAALASIVVTQRHLVLTYAFALSGAPELTEPSDEGPDVRWVDDYFTVQQLDPRTFAIGEPRYHQQNYSYLIVGSKRAVLFDAGPGLRDIRPVAQSLTDRPITFIPSHFHYDHVGNDITFDHVAIVDLPYLRKRAPEGQLELTLPEHLGVAEGISLPTLEIDEWLAPQTLISLGDRSLRVLHTPGHTEESISLLDTESGDLFTGDFIYPGPLVGFLPNSGLGDYLQGADTVLNSAPAHSRLFGAHRVERHGAPQLAIGDVQDLRSALRAIQRGELAGADIYPVVYPINARMELYAEPALFHRWTPRHPNDSSGKTSSR